MTFLDVWIGYAIFGVTIFSAVFVWAVRARQFTDLDRARYIALKSEQPIESAGSRAVGRLDRYTWVGLAVLTLAVVVSGLWLGLRGG